MRLLGPVEAEELVRLYRAADVFAFPSVVEGFGLAAIEALAGGLPVVASDLDVFREFLVPGRNALLTPAGDAARSRRSWCAWRANPRCARGWRGAARGSIAEWTWDAAAEAHERAYRTLLGADRRTEAA